MDSDEKMSIQNLLNQAHEDKEKLQSKIDSLNEELNEKREEIEEIRHERNRASCLLDEYETELLDKCFNQVFGSTLTLNGDDTNEEFEILSKGDLVRALLTQYSFHLKGFDTEIDEEEDED